MEAVHIPVWSGTPPHAELWEGVSERVGPSPFDGQAATFNVTDPRLEVLVPEQPSGTTALICPGGGFQQLSMDSEGRVLAGMLAARGVTAAVLAYRLVPTPVDDEECAQAMYASFGNLMEVIDPYLPAANADAQQAVQVLRAGAGGLVTTERLVGIGFSAGSRLVGRLALSSNPELRLDAAACIYMASLVLPDLDVPAHAPPLFLLGAADDPLGFAGADAMHHAWLGAGRPVEYHLYERGGHGFGTNRYGLPIDSWPDRWFDWLTSHGML